MSWVNVYLTFRMLLYFRNLIASLSNVKCGVMLWSDNGNIMDYWMFVARYCFKYGFLVFLFVVKYNSDNVL